MAIKNRTRKPRNTKQTDAEAQAAADAAADIAEGTEEANFTAAVAAAENDMPAAMSSLMSLHQGAVESKAAVDGALKIWREKNAGSLDTLRKCQVRLAVARTALRNEWAELVNGDEQTTTVEVEDAGAPNIVYFNALDFAFDDGVAENATGPEKEYWLAAQSFNRVKSSMSSEPSSINELREAADAAAQAFNWAESVYNEALRRQIGR